MFLTKSIISIIIASFSPLLLAAEPVDLTEPMRQSLVYIEVSSVGWEQIQPWRQTAVNTVGTYGCAVGPNEVLTLARPMTNAVSLQVRRYAQNEYIPAKIKAIDYEYNLCLIELEAAALQTPLVPLSFSDNYPKNMELRSYWLSSGGHLTTGRATLDRADVMFSNTSFVKTLHYVLSNPSRATGNGEVYCLEAEPMGMACWSSETEVGLIPAETINRFLSQAHQPNYAGFGATGFETSDLLDPAVRNALKMPADVRHGVYVSTVYKMGTGSSELISGDVILAINEQTLNSYGRYLDPRYDRLGLEHLIGRQQVGDRIMFQIWRNGKEESVEVVVRNIIADQMLIPYYNYGHRPEYLVIGGFVLQKLTRDYMTMWGDGWQGKTPPHLFQYYRGEAFKPTAERKDVVLLSYVLPTEMNLGYQQLGRLIVKSINGNEIGSFDQVFDALEATPESPFHVIEFELSSPAVIIPKNQLPQTDRLIMQNYGIRELFYRE